MPITNESSILAIIFIGPPQALQMLNLDLVVRSLPIFNDLGTLASLGTFSGNDLKDISETMHQGALLTLESGVILIDEDMVAQGGRLAHSATPATSTHLGATASAVTETSAAENDEHYNRYLREREAMMRSQANSAGDAINGHANAELQTTLARAQAGAQDDTRKEAVDDLLKSLQQSRSS